MFHRENSMKIAIRMIKPLNIQVVVEMRVVFKFRPFRSFILSF